MSGKPKGSGKRLTVPVLQGPSRNRRPQPRREQPQIRPWQPETDRASFEEHWKEMWRGVEQKKINNAQPQMRGFLQDRKGREVAVDNEIDVLKRQRVAFMQGSNRIHLLSVLTGGGLLCSDFLRSLSRATFTKDAGNGTGDVCYFRFVMDTRSEGHLDRRIVARNIHNFASVGASGGIFYVLRADDMSGLSYRTASSTDSKGKGTETIEQVVQRNVWKKNENNSEIGFSRAVDFARISEVYIGTEIVGNATLGDPIYNNAAALLEELERKGISLPEKRTELRNIKRTRSAQWTIPLLKFFLEMAGFASRGLIQTSKGEFDVLERTGAPDYVRGFRYNPEREAYPYPFPAEEDFLAGISATSEQAPHKRHAEASQPAPRAKVSAASGQTGSRKRSQHAAQAQIVKPSVGAGNKKAGVGGGRLRK